jgi:hypothetical protein
VHQTRSGRNFLKWFAGSALKPKTAFRQPNSNVLIQRAVVSSMSASGPTCSVHVIVTAEIIEVRLTSVNETRTFPEGFFKFREHFLRLSLGVDLRRGSANALGIGSNGIDSGTTQSSK